MIVTSGHGYDPEVAKGIQTSDGKAFGPSDLDATKISGNLQTVILENCYQGDEGIGWQSALEKDVSVVGWNGTTYVLETMSFNTIGIFDRQDNNLRAYEEELVEAKGGKER
jgi:hypothetical protein